MRPAERAVLGLLGVAFVGAVAFIVAYALEWSTQALGLALGGSFVAIAASLILAGKRVAPGQEVQEPRPSLANPEEQQELEREVERGGEGISRRRVLLGGAAAAGTALAGALAVPVASLGPKPGDRIGSTPWRAGTRVVSEDGAQLAPVDVDIGTFVTGFPEGADPRELGSPVVLVRLDPGDLDLPADRSDWDADGVLAFSKICTHAGCAINLYRFPAFPAQSPGPALVCPCHYSTFDPATGGNRIFGPAGRALPQLPLDLDGAGGLIAAGEFSGHIGPAWWGVRKS
jgi:ubiquinol-cytochrome c reductase iron-sulfur subunit